MSETTACERCGAFGDLPHTWVDDDCILPHRNHSTRLLEGAFVCVPCVDRHRDWLSEIVELYATLGDVLLAGSIPDNTAEHQRPRKAPASPSPLRLQAWALLHGRLNDHIVDVDYSTGRRVETSRAAYLGANLPDVPAVLTGWAQACLDGLYENATAPTSVSGAAATLRVNAERIARTPYIDDYDAELRWVRTALLHAHGRDTHGRRPVGRCPSLDGHGVECGGPLWPDPAGRMAVDCGRCDRHYNESFLRHLGGMIAS